MAMPPTKIYEYIKETHSDTYDALVAAGLVKEGVSRNEFIGALESKEQKYLGARHDVPGPNLMDNIAEAVFSFLNEKGKKLSEEY